MRISSAALCAPSAFICVFIAFLPASSAAAAISLTDDLGRKVELHAPAQRIVSLAPSLTELVYTAGAGDRLVAASEYSDYPPEARKLPRVSAAGTVSLEPVAALRPDLVLAWEDGTRPEDIERLAALGIPVYVAHARTLDDVPRLLVAIGTLVGTDPRAAARAYSRKLDALRRQYAARTPVTVLLEVWHSPLTTIAGRHFMNEALATCGARNVFADLPGVAPIVSWEEVFRRDPDAIVGIGSAPNEAELRALWDERSVLRAVKQGHLVFADADRLQRLSARTPEGVAALCAAIDRVRSAAPRR
ncbi:MAG TPA: cobalamin-binding protein [Usitatibacter sp.]|nr:cobalamin-binding protein [Usitatibacter sp.]